MILAALQSSSSLNLLHKTIAWMGSRIKQTRYSCRGSRIHITTVTLCTSRKCISGVVSRAVRMLICS